jgi:ribosomal protein L11 methyltransferase
VNEKYIEIILEVQNREQGEVLIACLSDIMETTGFEEGEGYVKAYVPEAAFNEAQLLDLTCMMGIKYTRSVIKNKNWNALWESEFKPVVIDDFVTIRADFHKPLQKTAYEIIITPKMSFGTGHHATTALMLESLQQYGCAGRKIADFGTGTGVLAILSEKAGAAEVLAIDHDDWSIENASENIKKNQCKNIRLTREDHFPGQGEWDIILANINLPVIMANMENFYRHLKNDGLLIISGILQENRKDVEFSAAGMSFITDSVREKNNWLCMAFKRKVVA